jgi:hypothetical protein
MNHPAELAINQYLEDATSGKSTMSEETIKQIGADVMDAVRRQFGGGNKRDKFRLRMSNVGRPTCQLWFEKNKPEKALPKPTTFVMNMLMGDIVEAAFKGIITEAGVKYEDDDNFVELQLGDTTVKGSYDLVLDGAVDDVKSASDWSYRNKFESFQTLKDSDPFGYVGQLAGYAKAAGKKAGGWWVVNKANGGIKYVPAEGIDIDAEITTLEDTVATVNANEFRRCFDPVPETFRGKASGNKVLNSNCKFCDYRFECYPTLQELPSKVSQAKVKPTVAYVEVKEY